MFVIDYLFSCSFASAFDCRYSVLATALIFSAMSPHSTAQPHSLAQAEDEQFQNAILPTLKTYCFDCHSGDAKEGKVQFDFENPDDLIKDKSLWLKVLRNIRADMMPPRDAEQPSSESKRALTEWIHSKVFQINADDPFPGLAPIRRLNRTEYRNTIRDLMGVDFNAEVVFPPDDTGFGFDNISEAMSLSPMLIEKYFQAARSIVDDAVPKTTWVAPSSKWNGKEFLSEDQSKNGRSIRHDQPVTVQNFFEIKHAGEYRLLLKEKLDGSFDFHPGQYQINCSLDGNELYSAKYKWEEDKFIDHAFVLPMDPGPHHLSIQLSTLENGEFEISEVELKTRSVTYEILSATLDGPMGEAFREHPHGYQFFFPRESPPTDMAGRREYALEILSRFATKAYRRPASPVSCERLVSLAESIYQQSEMTFESGIEKAMMAVLASPQFLFRAEEVETLDEVSQYPNVDEYGLASRLSYLLWSTMPDDELFALADRAELRKNLASQIDRMLQDKRCSEFVESFAGQWLRARDVENVSIDPIAAMGFQKEYSILRNRFAGRGLGRRSRQNEPAEAPETVTAHARFTELNDWRNRFDASVRSAMRKETEMAFECIVREDRSLLDLIDTDYVFVNEKLASLYGLEGISGNAMQRVTLPVGSPRGGVLTQGTMLAVTSNPTRTSPVKRGLFILDNILGTPAPPAPPNVPALEDAADRFGGREPSLRELLAVHREAALCSSCHSRMDPLGLALENFNAIGGWRDMEADQPIESAGELITGEKFTDIRDLKRILKTDRRRDFYRCVTEKLFVYALGRGLEYYDEVAVNTIVEKLDREGGRFSVLLYEVINSAPFQRRALSQEELHQPQGQ